MSEFTQYVNERWARERKITAAREAVIAAARAWQAANRRADRDEDRFTMIRVEAALEYAVEDLDRLEATDGK